MKIKLPTIILFSLIFGVSSCVKKLEIIENPNSQTNTDDITALTVADYFDWETFSVITASIQTLDNSGVAIPNIKVSLFTDYELFEGKEIISGFTNENGLFEIDYRIASAIDSLVVATNYIGFVNEIKVPIISGQLDYVFGGIPDRTDDVGSIPSNKSTVATKTLIELNILGDWKYDGSPRYLENDGDNITADFLTEINNALPENQPVPEYHPEYLQNSYEQYINLNETADIWVTFVAEGAGYLNSLCYYTFDKNNPPQNIEDIDEATIIFPNASFKHSGGGLYSGDKVHLGQFPAGTSIGWLLITNAYNARNREVTDGENYLFSHKDLNPESDLDYQQHIVLLKDAERDIFIVAFEDLERPNGDDDFNDAIFYATVNPASAVDDSSLPTMGAVVVDNDTDDDGVDDNFDDYPEDNTKAFNNYYPSQDNYSTLAFEDLWPAKGDYDFNDLVVDYNFNTITNADNEVVKLEGEFIVRAIGAGFHNGFGFELENILSDEVNTVTGMALEEGYINLNANGTESEQTNATVIVFDDAWNHGYGNTDPDKVYAEPTEVINIELTLTNPVSLDQFGLAPFNPFIIVNQERGREIHLANSPPTDLADLDYFGKYYDDSDPASGKYYKTIGNLPWAINFPVQFEYPIEKSSVDKGHLKFIPWVESSGILFNDWYLNLSDYRNDDYIY